MSSSIVWPRHEVLQLINPTFAQTGRSLTNSLAVEASRHLAKMQSPDRSISFEQWQSVATEFLKWNDNYIRLFWDMLHICTWYKQSSEWSQHSDFVNIGYLVVFLVMHSTTASRPVSPTRHSVYESVWPSENGAVPPAPSPRSNFISSVSPPTSPEKSLRKAYHGAEAGGNVTPLSPRTSPRQATSPKRNSLRTFTHYKSSTQHISFVREKLSTLAHALSLLDSASLEHEGGGSDSRRYSEDSVSSDKLAGIFASAFLSPASLDALGLILGGGDDSNEVRNLASVFPILQTEFDDDDCGEEEESGGSTRRGLSVSGAIEWIETHLHLNEALYPPCPISSTNSFSSHSPLNSPRNGTHVVGEVLGSGDSSGEGLDGVVPHSVPTRRVIPLSSPQAREPTVVYGSNSTVLNVLSVDSAGLDSGSASIPMPAKLHSISNDSDMVLSSPGGGMTSVGSEDDLLESLRPQQSSATDMQSSNVPHTFGPALVHGCSRMTVYLLGAYSTVTVSSCVDCEIVVGAVGGCVLMSSCERVHITVACRKMVIWSCHDCDVRLATLTPSIMSGDCRKLVFGPFNTSYRLLRVHLRLAQLENLMSGKHIAASHNCWHDVFDVGVCGDVPAMSPPGSAPSSPHLAVSPGSSTFLVGSNLGSDYSSGCNKIGVSSGLASLPRPPDSLASLQNPEKYAFLSIPYQPEYQPFEMCPFLIPERYVEAYMRRKQAQRDIQRRISLAMSKTPAQHTGNDVGEAFGKAMSQQFLEWLVQSGKCQQLLDLVRIDAEESQNSAQEDCNPILAPVGNAGASGRKSPW